jgi:triacylglycerol lipase
MERRRSDIQMNGEDMVGNTRSLIAAELLPGLDILPTFELSDELVASMRSAGPIGNLLGSMDRPPLVQALQAVNCEERFIAGAAGSPEVRILLYTPHEKATAPRPACLHVHGGGYVLGGPEMNDEVSRAMVAELGCAIVSVDYRLAPETHYPHSLEDCYAALRWLNEEAEALGVNRNAIAVTGESAGGGHAASLATLARDRGEFKVCLQSLDSPMLDDRTGSGVEPHAYCGEFVWTARSNRYGWRALLGVEPGGNDVPIGAVPARTPDLSGMPPTFITVGAVDLFAEESMEYARRLIRAGVPTELHVIPGAFHGFQVVRNSPQALACERLRFAALARAFADHAAAGAA